MINFAENIAYWYLRFNGFFSLQNFVLHKVEQVEGKSVRGTADSDLLAIRFPYVYEEIGGQKNDWDCKQFKSWGIQIDKFHLAFIVEVTSSRSVISNQLKSTKFSCERLEQAIQRFGIFQKDEVSCIVKTLYQKDKYIKDHWIIAKLAVTENSITGPWLNLSLANADKFIRRRIKSYSRNKYSDRTYFPDVLIQYLAWKGNNSDRNSQKNKEAGLINENTAAGFFESHLKY